LTCAAPLPPTPSASPAVQPDRPHVFADLSKNLLDTATEALLLELARQCGVEEHRDAMFAGSPSTPPSNVR
jgi:glucose-6-phosphate isomerase